MRQIRVKSLKSQLGIFGFISDLFGGGKAAKASTQAANVQAKAGQQAIDVTRESRDMARTDLQPFRDAGQSALPGLTSLVNDPNAQYNYVKESPFYKLLADDAQSRLFANQAARGKVGSGETANALQNSLMLLGQNLLQGDINNRFNLASMGSNAAAGQANITTNSGQNISDLTTDIGNVNAAGITGAANAKTNAFNSGLNTALGVGSILALSDKRAKKNIVKIGKDEKGLNVYEFEYKGDDTTRVGHMAQEVEKKYPQAVKNISNLKLIDYGVLNNAS